MKRLIALLLCAVTLLSLAACDGEEKDPNELIGGVIVDDYNYITLTDKLTQAQIDAFPIKRSDMTVAEMRQLCVDFFRFSKGALWMPMDTVGIPSNYAGTTLDQMTKGTPYGGLPYVANGGCSSVYRMMDYYNEEKGVLDIKRASAKSAGLFGNHCSGAAYWGWARVINSANYEFCAEMTHSRGFLRVGPYTYSDRISKFSTNFQTTTICADNGANVMFQSYAQLQLGDGLVYYTTGGHVIMVSSEPHVEYLEDGSIDPNKSYMTILEQGQFWKPYTSKNGDSFQAKESIDKKVSFLYLFDHNYIPFTFAEFLGTDPVEETQCTSSLSGESVTLSQIFSSTIQSNYAISDVYVLISNDKGVVKKVMVKAPAVHTMELSLRSQGSNVDTWGEPNLSKGEFTVEIQVQLGTGERPTVYSGKLAK